MRKSLVIITAILAFFACKNNSKTTVENSTLTEEAKKYPSDVMPFMDKWQILLGDGTRSKDLVNFHKDDYFYVVNENETDWVVYKTPNAGITSPNSSNTRTELGEKKRWIPEEGGKLTGTLKVQHVSTTGDATARSSYSVVVGQIHSDEGHENEPLKIYYKKFPGHEKGSVFWNYEINTEGNNDGRWDFSTSVWGHDFSVLGTSPNTYPEEPVDGISLGEEFSYEVNVYKGIMHLTFTSEGHENKIFTKNLLKSDFAKEDDIPQQVIDWYSSRRHIGVERDSAYAGEKQFFKQGAYNQANRKSTKSETYNGDITKQYAHGSYAEVWFKNGSLGEGTNPDK